MLIICTADESTFFHGENPVNSKSTIAIKWKSYEYVNKQKQNWNKLQKVTQRTTNIGMKANNIRSLIVCNEILISGLVKTDMKCSRMSSQQYNRVYKKDNETRIKGLSRKKIFFNFVQAFLDVQNINGQSVNLQIKTSFSLLVSPSDVPM